MKNSDRMILKKILKALDVATEIFGDISQENFFV